MSSPPPHATRFGALDPIRVLAMLWVAWFHYFGLAVRNLYGREDPRQWLLDHELLARWSLYVTELSLQLFMMLSAFSLTYQALERGRFSYGRWLVARARRIYPALWTALLLVLATDAAAAWMRTGDPRDGLRLSLSDVAWNATGFTCSAWAERVGGAWWFIGLIVSFYVCFPLFLFFARRGLSLVLLAFSVLFAVYSREDLAGALAGVYGNPASSFLGSRALEFSFGVLLGELFHRRRLGLGSPFSPWPVRVLLFLLAWFALSRFALERSLAPFGPAVAALVFCALFALFEGLPARLSRGCAALAGPSLLFYLLHHSLLTHYVPLFDGAPAVWAIPVFLLFALLLGAACVALQPLVERFGRLVFRGRGERGRGQASGRRREDSNP